MPDTTTALLQAKQALQEAINQKKLSQDLLKNLGPAVIETIRPVLEEIARNAKVSKEDLMAVISSIKIDAPDVPKAEVKVSIPEIKVPEPKVTVNVADIKVPEIKIPQIKIPQIKVPEPKVTVNVPPVKIPPLEWPDENMPIEGWVRLQGVDLKNPVPVRVMNENIFKGLTQAISGGGIAKMVKVSGVGGTVGMVSINPDGNVIAGTAVTVTSVTGTIGANIVDSSGVAFGGANPLDIDGTVIVSSITNTTAANIVDSTGVAYTTSNPLPTTLVSGGTATSASAIVDSTGIQYSGSNPLPITVAGASGTTAVNIVDSTGVAFGGANPMDIDGTVVVSGITASTAAMIVDSTSVAYSGSNPIPTTIISDGAGLATSANQLADGHNVTIDNAAAAAAVNIQDGGNTITVDGTVTANLSATDNAVLDSIDTSTASKYITGIGHGVKTVTTAGTDEALAGSTACKRVTIQAQTDNTGWIAVGTSGVDATVATGTGVLLGAGDSFELEIDNLSDVYIDSTVNGEGARYIYFT